MVKSIVIHNEEGWTIDERKRKFELSVFETTVLKTIIFLVMES